MNKDNPILIVGNANAKHLWRFAHFYKSNDNRKIDILNTGSYCKNDKIEFDNIYEIKGNFNMPKIRVIINGLSRFYLLCKLIRRKHYSLINIHYVDICSVLFLFAAKLFSIPVLLTPWGSDFYRISVFEYCILRIVYKHAEYISFGNSDFIKDVTQLFGISPNKIVYLPIGSETINFINNNRNKTKKDILKELKLPENSFIITCGYTAAKAQRHKVMISAISEIKNYLPDNTLLIFPLTYGPDKEIYYIEEIKELVKKNRLNAIYFTDYMNANEVALLRLASDIFIHIQPTDGFSASLQEYLLAGGICINGSWLKYSQLEKYGYPYIVLDNLGNLQNILLSIINHEIEIPIISSKLVDNIKNRSWNKVIHFWIDFYNNF